MTSLGDWKKEANTHGHSTTKIKEYQSKVKKKCEMETI